MIVDRSNGFAGAAHRQALGLHPVSGAIGHALAASIPSRLPFCPACVLRLSNTCEGGEGRLTYFFHRTMEFSPLRSARADCSAGVTTRRARFPPCAWACLEHEVLIVLHLNIGRRVINDVEKVSQHRDARKAVHLRKVLKDRGLVILVGVGALAVLHAATRQADLEAMRF